MLLSATAQKLQEVGVQTLGVVASTPERTRLYFRFRPPRFPLGADPDLATHRTYGLPNVPITDEVWQAARVAAAKELGGKVPATEAYEVLGRFDGYQVAEPDQAELQRHQGQLTGQFLVNEHGIVTWAYVECARNGLAGIDQFHSDEELLAAARALR